MAFMPILLNTIYDAVDSNYTYNEWVLAIVADAQLTTNDY